MDPWYVYTYIYTYIYMCMCYNVCTYAYILCQSLLPIFIHSEKLNSACLALQENMLALNVNMPTDFGSLVQ